MYSAWCFVSVLINWGKKVAACFLLWSARRSEKCLLSRGLPANVSSDFFFLPPHGSLCKLAHCPTLWMDRLPPTNTPMSFLHCCICYSICNRYNVDILLYSKEPWFTATWCTVTLQLVLIKHSQNRLLGEKWTHPGRAKPCGCSLAEAVTQCDKLTCVFKSLFPGHFLF